MKYDRRHFLKASSATALGMLILPSCGSSSSTKTAAEVASMPDIGVGLQLYTIRDAISEDLEGSLEKVAEMGYKNLELANYWDGKFYGKTPQEFKKMMNDFGFTVVSSHTSVEAEGVNVETARKMADAHAELGVAYCVQPWVQAEDRNVERYKQLVSDWNQVGEIMKNVGIQFGYHNHNFEFENLDGVVPYYDILMPELDKDLVVMELDLFWATKAGQDPVEIFEKYPGRFHLLHLKDMSKDNAPYFTLDKDDITSVGSGLIDFKRIISASETGGVKYGFVEDDNQGSGTPFKAIETSINNLNDKILS
jgi:sugar phosphate isomerase/epimerase